MDGIIIVNKEKEWTSNDVVQKVKHIFHEKTGHTGTLDPMATGVLPILVGKGTLLAKYLVNHDKEYRATIQLGQKTTTGDSEGDVIEEKEVSKEMLQEENVRNVLKSVEGKQSQMPPMYSAIKVNGKKLYEYARKGQTVEIESREITIYKIELVAISEEKQEITYQVSCSKGTYIRSLSEGIASRLGTVGFMKELQRTKVGDFSVEQAVKVSELENQIEENFITIEEFFKHKKEITLEEKRLKQFLNGVKIRVPLESGIYRIYDENSQFIGIGKVENGRLKRDIVK